MSEQTPEPRPPAGRRGGGGAMGGFTAKWGPLPVWGWLGLLAVLVIGGTLVWRHKSTQQQQPANVAPGTSTGATGNANTVPQFVNQTYTTVTAPEQTTINEPPEVEGPTAPIVINPPPPPVKSPKPPPEPSTVSGSPGSYTTNVGGKKVDEWTSTGKYSLNTIAKSHGMTAQQLINSSLASANNPGLKKYVAGRNYNKPVPAGVQLFFPAADWAVRH